MELNSEQESSIISDIINFKARSGPFQVVHHGQQLK